MRRACWPVTGGSPRWWACFRTTAAARVTFSSRGVRSLVGAHPVRDSLSRRLHGSLFRQCRFRRLLCFGDRARLRPKGVLVGRELSSRCRGRVTFSSRGVRSLVGAPSARQPFAPVCTFVVSMDEDFWRCTCWLLATWLACRGLPSRCRGPGHFLLLAQEKVTKENGTPRGAVWALPSQSVRGGRAFRPGSCPDEKCPTSCRAPLRGLIDHPSPPHRGYLKARAAERHIASRS